MIYVTKGGKYATKKNIETEKKYKKSEREYFSCVKGERV